MNKRATQMYSIGMEYSYTFLEGHLLSLRHMLGSISP